MAEDRPPADQADQADRITDRANRADRFSFRPVQPDDLSLLARWRSSAHVVQWWDEPRDLEAEYISGTDPVRYFIALLDGRPAGLVQHYHWADFPAEADVIKARPDEDGIDYFLGEPELSRVMHLARPYAELRASGPEGRGGGERFLPGGAPSRRSSPRA